VDVSFWYLQSRGNPDAVDWYVNGSDQNCNNYFEPVGLLVIGEENAASVDDNLEEKLDL
jgi:hypothetical protein